MDRKELRTIYFYEFGFTENASKVAKKINERFGPNTTTPRTVERWFKRFREGQFSLDDKGGRGRPTEVDDAELRTIIESDPTQTTRDIAKTLGVSHKTVMVHLQQIGKVKERGRWVSKD